MNALINALNHGGELWWRYALHAAWQATLLAVVVLIIVRLGRRWPAPLRYWLLIIALVKFAMPPLLQAPVGLFSRVGPQLAPRQAGQPALLARADTLPVFEFETTAAPDASGEVVEPDVWEESTDPEVAADLVPLPVVVGEETPLPDETPRQPGPVVAVSTSDAGAPATRAGLRWQAWLLIGHVLGVMAIAAWTLWQVIALRRTVRGAELVRDGDLYERFLGLWRAMSLRRAPRLLVSPEPIAPMVVGVLKPAVVVPAAAETLAGRDLDTMLTHELAHVRRRDTWINWFQIVVVAVWWFNPVVWLLNRAVRKVREDCCDDLVLSRGHSTNDAYCQTLLHAASRLAVTSPVGTRLGFADRLHPLGRRLRRIMDRTLRRAPALSLWGIVLVALLAVVLLPGLSRRGETTEPKTGKQAEEAESEEAASEAAEASADTPALGKLEKELAAQEKALADQFEAAADVKYKQIDAITAEHKRGVVSDKEAREQLAKLVRDMAEDRLRAVELRLSAAERELSILKLSVPPGGAVPDAVREKTDEIKSLRSQVKKKQYDFADGITHVVQEREGRIKRLRGLRAEQEAGLLSEREANIEIANLQLLNAQDKVLVTKLRYLAESNQTYSAKVLGADTRGAVTEPGARPGVDEVLHWETLLLQARAELIRHEHEWGPENEKRKAQEKIVALYEAKLEEARKQAAADLDLPRAGAVEPGSRPELNDALLDAAKEGNLAGVKSLLERGAFVSTRDEKNRTPLHWALAGGYDEVALFLIEQGADLRVESEADGTPLHRAARSGDVPIVTRLIEAGADVNAGREGGTSPLWYAAVYGRTDVFKLLIEKGAEVDAEHAGDWRVLYAAVTGGHVEIVRQLLKLGVPPDRLQEGGAVAESLLTRALQMGHLDVARALLDAGANPNGTTTADRPGDTPLHTVANYHPANRTQMPSYFQPSAPLHPFVEEAAKLLIEKGADVNRTEPRGRTPLDAAVDKQRAKLVDVLLSAKADPNRRSGGRGDSLLLCAVKSQNADIVRSLIAAGADPNTGDRRSPLTDAVSRDNKEIAKLLIAAGADPNVTSAYGSPLSLAASKDDVELAKLLLAAGADPNATDRRWRSPLSSAVSKDNKELAKLLLDAGADPVPALTHAVPEGRTEMAELLLTRVAKSGLSKEAATQLLGEAVAHGQAGVVKLLLERGADPNTASRSRGAPLTAAMKGGHKQIAALLLKHGADPTVRSRSSASLLHAAVGGADPETFQLVLARGGDPDIRDPSGRTLLHAAVLAKRPEIAKILLDNKADPNARDSAGWTPLHHAVQHAVMPVLEVLIAGSADVNPRDRLGDSPLHIAARRGHQEVVEVLLKKKADPDTRNNKGCTPLYYAVEGQRIAIAKILLAKKADPNIADKGRRTPLHIAAEKGDSGLVKLLLAAGADPSLKDEQGFTPVHRACRLPVVDTVAALVAGGAELNVRDGEGNAPLHTAIAKRNEALLKLLLKSAADANLRDRNGDAPLHLAVRNGNEAMVALLLDSGADIHAKGQDERRALHDAALTGDTAIARRLLTAGADVNAATKDGVTPLHDAAGLGFAPMVKLLLEKGAAVDPRTGEGYQLFAWIKHGPTAVESTLLEEVTPLLCAAAGGHADAAALLVKAGADADTAESEQKRTSLHLAARNGDENLVRLLLDSGANPRTEDSSGQTPLDMATKSGNAGCIALLTAATEGSTAPVPKNNPGDDESKGTRETHQERVRRLVEDMTSSDKARVAAATKELADTGGPSDLFWIGEAVYRHLRRGGANQAALEAIEEAGGEIIARHWDELNETPNVDERYPAFTGILTRDTPRPFAQLGRMVFNETEMQWVFGGRDSLDAMWERLGQLTFDEDVDELKELPDEVVRERKLELVGVFVNLWLRFVLKDDEIERFLRTQIQPRVVARDAYCRTEPIYFGIQLSMGSFGPFVPRHYRVHRVRVTPIVDGTVQEALGEGADGVRTGGVRYYCVPLSEPKLALGTHSVKFHVEFDFFFNLKRRHLSFNTDEQQFEVVAQWPEGAFGPVTNPELDEQMRRIIKVGPGPTYWDMQHHLTDPAVRIWSDEPLPVAVVATVYVEDEGREGDRRHFTGVVFHAREKVNFSLTGAVDDERADEHGMHRMRVVFEPIQDWPIRDPRIGQYWVGEYASHYFDLMVTWCGGQAGKRKWGPEQATAAPDSPQPGDRVTAWASKSADGQDEWLVLEYREAVSPSAIRVYETYNPGALYKVSVLDAEGKEHIVWEGDDPTAPTNEMGVSEIEFTTEFETKRVKLYLKSKEVKGWNGIDAVGLVDADGNAQWAASALASSTFAQ